MIWWAFRTHAFSARTFVVSGSVGLLMFLASALSWSAWPYLFVLPLLILLFPARTSMFEMLLPVHGRTTAISRALANLYVVLLPLAIWRVVLIRWPDPAWHATRQLAVVAIAACVALLPFTMNAREASGPSWRRLLALAASLVGVCAAGVIWLPAAIALTLFCIVLVAIAQYAWRLQPVSLVASARNDDTDDASLRELTHGAHSISAAIEPTARWWTLLARLALPRLSLIMTIPMFLLGAVGGGAYIIAISFASGVDQALVRARWLDALPFSRWQLFAIKVLPTLLLPALALTLGVWSHGMIRSFRSMGVNAVSTTSDWDPVETRTAVPFAFWARAVREDDLSVRSPWGEQSTVFEVRVFGVRYYNPYSTSAHSSEQFVRWQFARATQAVHGVSFDNPTYSAERTQLPRRLTDQWRVKILEGALIVAYALIRIWFGELSRLPRIARRPWASRTVITVAFVFMMLPVLPIFLFAQHNLNPVTDLAEWGVYHLVASWQIAAWQSLAIAVAALAPIVLLVERQMRLADPPTLTAVRTP